MIKKCEHKMVNDASFLCFTPMPDLFYKMLCLFKTKGLMKENSTSQLVQTQCLIEKKVME